MDDLIPAPAPGCPRCAQFAKLVKLLRARIEQLQGRIAQLEGEVRELRARLNTHSGNSSILPSANIRRRPLSSRRSRLPDESRAGNRDTPATIAFAFPGRGCDALQQLLGSDIQGTLSSDRWGGVQDR